MLEGHGVVGEHVKVATGSGIRAAKQSHDPAGRNRAQHVANKAILQREGGSVVAVNG
jgi:hypothetical protein